jgi:hypothetical protein
LALDAGIDPGTDISADKFMASAREYPGCIVGLSAMLTTTMINMSAIVKRLKKDARSRNMIKKHTDYLMSIYRGGKILFSKIDLQ